MSLGYPFKKARKTLGRLTPVAGCALEKICRDIQQAEESLLEAAEDALVWCHTACKGIYGWLLKLTSVTQKQ